MDPKISTVESFFLIAAAVIADILSLIPMINWIVWLGMSAIMLYLKFGKGILPASNLVAFIAEFVPVVSMLPLYTVGMVATIIIDRNPRIITAIAGTTTSSKTTVRTPIGGMQRQSAAPTTVEKFISAPSTMEKFTAAKPAAAKLTPTK